MISPCLRIRISTRGSLENRLLSICSFVRTLSRPRACVVVSRCASVRLRFRSYPLIPIVIGWYPLFWFPQTRISRLCMSIEDCRAGHAVNPTTRFPGEALSLLSGDVGSLRQQIPSIICHFTLQIDIQSTKETSERHRSRSEAKRAPDHLAQVRNNVRRVRRSDIHTETDPSIPFRNPAYHRKSASAPLVIQLYWNLFWPIFLLVHGTHHVWPCGIRRRLCI